MKVNFPKSKLLPILASSPADVILLPKIEETIRYRGAPIGNGMRAEEEILDDESSDF
jgi:hypothetical protein